MIPLMRHYLADIPIPYVLSMNAGVLGVSFTNVEATLKIILLAGSILLTLASLYYKVKNRGK